MESPTPSLREQGLQALRESNIDSAVDLLARAVMADGRDAEAQAFLGVAYSRQGQHALAARALRTAVELQPGEARYRFNLGVALESAGDAEGAAMAYREALRLNPRHPQAGAKLQALGVPAAPAAADFSVGAVGQSAAPSPWASGAAGPSRAPAGAVTCPSCKQSSKPGLLCEWCSAPLKSPAMTPTAPWLQTAAGMAPVEGETARSAGSHEEDRFDIGQAFRDWLQILMSPRRFFQDQEGREGLKAPLGFLVIYLLFSIAGSIPMFLKLGASGLPTGMLLLFGIGVGVPLSLVGLFIWASIVHGASRLFGGQASYAGSFRAATYPLGPMFLVSVVAMLITLATGSQPMPNYGTLGSRDTAPGRPALRMVRSLSPDASADVRMARYRRRGYPGGARPAPVGPGNPYQRGGYPGGARAPIGPGGQFMPFGRPSPAAVGLNFLGGIYYLALLGMGVFHIHRLGSGAAIGVAILSAVAAIMAYFVLAVVIGVGVVALMGGMRAVGR